MHKGLLAALVLVASTMLGCSTSTVFTCQSDSQCETATLLGRCEADGVCSFPDLGCESERRYGEWSGDLSNTCVPFGGGSSGSGSSSDGGTGVGSSSDSNGSVSISSGVEGTDDDGPRGSSTGIDSATESGLGSSDTGEPPSTAGYGPCVMGECPVMGEQCATLQDNSWCAPPCVENERCPTSDEVASPTVCHSEDGLLTCALACDSEADCPDGMFCNVATMAGICVW